MVNGVVMVVTEWDVVCSLDLFDLELRSSYRPDHILTSNGIGRAWWSVLRCSAGLARAATDSSARYIRSRALKHFSVTEDRREFDSISNTAW